MISFLPGDFLGGLGLNFRCLSLTKMTYAMDANSMTTRNTIPAPTPMPTPRPSFGQFVDVEVNFSVNCKTERFCYPYKYNEK